MKALMKMIQSWLPLAIVMTVLSGLVYVTVQQSLRMGANDPQIQMSEDIAQQLANGQTVAAFLPPTTVEISQSLAPYVMIFNDAGQLVAGNAKLDGQAPNLPMGIFPYAKLHLQARQTWQPRVGVRSALIVTRYDGSKGSGFVAVGRSLREVEVREEQALLLTGFGWFVAMVGALCAVVILQILTGATQPVQRRKS